jgi:putative endonuclease
MQPVQSPQHDRSHYYVYIMASERQTIYTGVTSDLEARVWQHKNKLVPGFTAKYDCTKLVYYEVTSDVREAIAREKQIKGWVRRKKVALVRSMNPGWDDLSEPWATPVETSAAT